MTYVETFASSWSVSSNPKDMPFKLDRHILKRPAASQ